MNNILLENCDRRNDEISTNFRAWALGTKFQEILGLKEIFEKYVTKIQYFSGKLPDMRFI